MLIRTNLYLPDQILEYFKRQATLQGETMSALIRKILTIKMQEQNLDWKNGLLKLADQAGKSKYSDLSQKHDQYLY